MQKQKQWFEKEVRREKIKAREYARVFERVFSETDNDPAWFRKRDTCDFSRVDEQKFSIYFADMSKRFYLNAWDTAIKFWWLRLVIKKKGYRSEVPQSAAYVNRLVENSGPVSLRRTEIGYFFLPFSSYFKQFYPDSLKHDPWQEPDYFAFPFKHVSPAFLIPVFRALDCRIFLLQTAEKRKMSYAAFLDYVANFVLCYNAEQEKDVLGLIFEPQRGTFFVKNLVKNKKK